MVYFLNNSTHQRGIKASIYIFLLSLIYAVIRYHLFKGVSWVHFPLYLTNKAFSLSGIILISLSLANSKTFIFIKLPSAKFLGISGLYFVVIHVMISQIVLSPSLYGKFYQIDGSMNFKGEMSMLLGILALVTFLFPAFSAIAETINQRLMKYNHWRKLTLIGLLLASLHVLVMGWTGWKTVEKWPGYMPPISLLSFLVVAWAILMKYFSKVSGRITEELSD